MVNRLICDTMHSVYARCVGGALCVGGVRHHSILQVDAISGFDKVTISSYPQDNQMSELAPENKFSDGVREHV